MAKHLSEHLNSFYIGAANRLKPKGAQQKIVAYVESYDDIFFWRTVFDEFESSKYHFEVMLPSRDTLGKGKKRVLMNRLGSRLGQHMVACVDADYDYLLRQTTATSRQINNNPYVFHTYVYAIENYQCYAESLHSACVMATLNDNDVLDFVGFLEAYSRIVWPLFVWSIWMYRNDLYRNFTLTEFCNLITFKEINLYHPEYTLEAVQRRVNRKIAYLQRHFPQAKKSYGPLKEDLRQLGVTPETTYLYIQGHSLFDNVVMPMLTPVCTVLRKEREREIRLLAEHETQRQNELSCYQHSQNPIDAMLRKNVGYKVSAPYARLRADVRRLLERMEQHSAGSSLEADSEQVDGNMRSREHESES